MQHFEMFSVKQQFTARKSLFTFFQSPASLASGAGVSSSWLLHLGLLPYCHLQFFCLLLVKNLKRCVQIHSNDTLTETVLMKTHNH